MRYINLMLLMLTLPSFLSYSNECGSQLSGSLSEQQLRMRGHSDDILFATGSAAFNEASALDEVRRASLSNALANLGKLISVEVESQFSSVEQLQDSKFSESIFQTVRTTSDLTLQSVVIVGDWFDSQNCELWTKVSIDIRDANYSLISNLIKGLTIGFVDQTTLNSRLVQIRSMLSALLLNKADKNTLLSLYEPLETRFKEQSNLIQRITALSKKSAALADLPPGRQRRLLQTLERDLLEVMAKSIGDVYGVEVFPLALDSIVDVYTRAGAYCKGMLVTDRYPHFTEREPFRNAKALFEQNCKGSELSFEDSLVGGVLLITCQLTVAGESSHWEKACSEFSNMFAAKGMIVIVGDQGEISEEYTLVVEGLGDIENEGGSDRVRFSGEVKVTFSDEISVITSDVFSGMTGWSNYPTGILLDILALNIKKRFMNKLDVVLQASG